MENKVLEQNIEQIKHFNTKLADEILMFDMEKSNIELAQNENGEYNLLFNSIPLHSVNGVVEEAKQIVKNIQDKSNSIKLIYGFGLGYLPDEFSNKLQESKIVIYEENIDILKFAFSVAQFDMLSKENVVLFSKKEDLAKYISENIDENTEISISFLTSYKNLYFEKIKDILNFAQNIQAQSIGDKNTFVKKAPAGFYHTLANLRYIIRRANVVDIKDTYKGKTALIACAGPTLKENIETIKQNQDKFVIFALNPTVRTLFENGIRPDFIVAVESSNILKQFEGLDCTGCNFILEAFANKGLKKYIKTKVFNYISKDNFLNPWVRDCLKITDDLKTFGTVSYTALKSAVVMGFEKIILVGQDLAYKNGKCYSKECQWGDLECVFNENTKQYEIVVDDFEKFSKAFITPAMQPGEEIDVAKRRLEYLNKNLCTVKGQNGNYLPSQSGYKVFIECFQDAAKEIKADNSSVQLYNSSIGGAQIDGFELANLEKLVLNLEPVEKLDFRSVLPNYDYEYILSKINPFEKDLKEYISCLDELIAVIEKLVSELKNRKSFTDNAIKLAKKYTELLSKVSKFKTKEPLNILVVAQLYQIEKSFRTNFFEDVNTAICFLEKNNEEFKLIHQVAQKCDLRLCYCKSFILKKFFNV